MREYFHKLSHQIHINKMCARGRREMLVSEFTGWLKGKPGEEGIAKTYTCSSSKPTASFTKPCPWAYICRSLLFNSCNLLFSQMEMHRLLFRNCADYEDSSYYIHAHIHSYTAIHKFSWGPLVRHAFRVRVVVTWFVAIETHHLVSCIAGRDNEECFPRHRPRPQHLEGHPHNTLSGTAQIQI